MQTLVADAQLPTPSELPEADVVIYDGECRMCVGQVRRLAAWDGRGRLSFLSLHADEVARRYPQLKREALLKDLHVMTRAGACHRGAAAIRYLSRRLPRLWWLAPFLHVPGSLPLWQALYQLVARNRYRFGRIEECTDKACERHLK